MHTDITLGIHLYYVGMIEFGISIHVCLYLQILSYVNIIVCAHIKYIYIYIHDCTCAISMWDN